MEFSPYRDKKRSYKKIQSITFLYNFPLLSTLEIIFLSILYPILSPIEQQSDGNKVFHLHGWSFLNCHFWPK